MNEEELREKVEQLKRELLIRCNQSETAIELPLFYRKAHSALACPAGPGTPGVWISRASDPLTLSFAGVA
jgi:hypothetical protein